VIFGRKGSCKEGLLETIIGLITTKRKLPFEIPKFSNIGTNFSFI